MYCREDGTPYYIGKGKGERIHKPTHSVNLPVEERRKFLKTGLSEEESFRHEKYMIFVLGRKNIGTGILRNLTDGGEGCSGVVKSEELLQELKNRKWYNDGKKHIFTSSEPPEGYVRGRLHINIGRKFSPETKRKLSDRKKGTTRVMSEKEKTLRRTWKWWNNGVEERFSPIQPEGFVRGRVYYRNVKIKKNL